MTNPTDLRSGDFDDHIETNGHIAIEAPPFTRAIHADDAHWQVLENYGRTLGAVTTYPVRALPLTSRVVLQRLILGNPAGRGLTPDLPDWPADKRSDDVVEAPAYPREDENSCNAFS